MSVLLATVPREALAVILPIVGFSLAHSDVDALADLEGAVAHLRAALQTRPQTAARMRSQMAIETGDRADPYGGYRPFSIFPGQNPGGG